MLAHSVCFKSTQTRPNVSPRAPQRCYVACAHVRTRRIIGMRITPVLCVCAETRRLSANCRMKGKRVGERILVTAQKAIPINLSRIELLLTKQNWNI